MKIENVTLPTATQLQVAKTGLESEPRECWSGAWAGLGSEEEHLGVP